MPVEEQLRLVAAAPEHVPEHAPESDSGSSPPSSNRDSDFSPYEDDSGASDEISSGSDTASDFEEEPNTSDDNFITDGSDDSADDSISSESDTESDTASDCEADAVEEQAPPPLNQHGLPSDYGFTCDRCANEFDGEDLAGMDGDLTFCADCFQQLQQTAAVTIQRAFRSFIARRDFLVLKTKIITIQRAYRGFHKRAFRRRFLKTITATRTIQRFVRGFLTRCRCRRANEGLTGRAFDFQLLAFKIIIDRITGVTTRFLTPNEQEQLRQMVTQLYEALWEPHPDNARGNAIREMIQMMYTKGVQRLEGEEARSQAHITTLVVNAAVMVHPEYTCDASPVPPGTVGVILHGVQNGEVKVAFPGIGGTSDSNLWFAHQLLVLAPNTDDTTTAVQKILLKIQDQDQDQDQDEA